MERRMLLELENDIQNDVLKNNEVSNFTKELSESLSEINTYEEIDDRHFTNENEEKIRDKEKELKDSYINIESVEGEEEGKLYEITGKLIEGIVVAEYDGEYENRELLTVKEDELPANVKEGMFFRKVNNEYVFDEKVTSDMYENMKEYKNFLYEEQQKTLKEMRKEGAIYKVTDLSDDCEDWRTELTNLETGEIFQELEFPHDVYHQVGVDSLVKYENGRYSVVEGTSVYDLYPKNLENYCEIEGVYITQDGKFESSDELYESLNNKNENGFWKFLNKAIEKVKTFIEKVKESLEKMK